MRPYISGAVRHRLTRIAGSAHEPGSQRNLMMTANDAQVILQSIDKTAELPPLADLNKQKHAELANTPGNKLALQKLINRCKQAHGPNHELDREIGKLLGLGAHTALHFTDNEKHATLVIPGRLEDPFVWNYLVDYGGLNRCTISTHMGPYAQADGNSQALAFCAAGLIAHLNILNEKG